MRRLALLAALALSCGCGASTPQPTSPTPTTSSSPATGHWVGTGSDGMIVTSNPNIQCPGEFDLDLTLTGSGSTVSGSATTKMRATQGAQCSDVLGRVSTYGVSGTIQGNAISFDFPNSTYRFTGSVSGSRMTGTFVITEYPESGTFAVNRQ